MNFERKKSQSDSVAETLGPNKQTEPCSAPRRMSHATVGQSIVRRNDSRAVAMGRWKEEQTAGKPNISAQRPQDGSWGWSQALNPETGTSKISADSETLELANPSNIFIKLPEKCDDESIRQGGGRQTPGTVAAGDNLLGSYVQKAGYWSQSLHEERLLIRGWRGAGDRGRGNPRQMRIMSIGGRGSRDISRPVSSVSIVVLFYHWLRGSGRATGPV